MKEDQQHSIGRLEPLASTPEQFGAMVRSEIMKMDQGCGGDRSDQVTRD